MAAVGGILTMVGVVLAVQEAYDLYQTWAYAWALVAPGGVGLGLTIYGLFTGRRDDLRAVSAPWAPESCSSSSASSLRGPARLSDGRFGDLAEVAVPALSWRSARS